MDSSSSELTSELLDLTDVSVLELRSYPAQALEPCLRRLLTQVERPRLNVGTSGTPARAD